MLSRTSIPPASSRTTSASAQPAPIRTCGRTIDTTQTEKRPIASKRSKGHAFSLTKWYFDCVAADGRAVIAYWTSLEWRGVEVTWQNLTLYAVGEAPLGRSSLAPAPAPEVSDEGIVCHLPALGCVVTAASRQPPFEERLFATEQGGVVDWRVEAPVAAARFDLEGLDPVQGAGYVERVYITVPPWRLPIRELRWGRWLDSEASRSVVWIEWRGAEPRTWVFADGARIDAAVTDEGVVADGVRVLLDEDRMLHERDFAEIAAKIPPLNALVPKSLLELRETKWCSGGRLLDADGRERRGYAVHEVAVFR